MLRVKSREAAFGIHHIEICFVASMAAEGLFPSGAVVEFSNSVRSKDFLTQRRKDRSDGKGDKTFCHAATQSDPADVLETALLMRNKDHHSAISDIPAIGLFLCVSFALFASLR